MTLKELYSLPYLQDEIRDYENKIKEMEELAESITAKLTGMPQAGGVRDKVGECATMIAYYTEFLREAVLQKVAREMEIVLFIENVEEAELRCIMYKRFVEQKQWQEIADEIGGANTEDSVRKRCHRYVEKRATLSDMSA